MTSPLGFQSCPSCCRRRSACGSSLSELPLTDLADLADVLAADSLADLTDLNLPDASADGGDLSLLGLFNPVVLLVVVVVNSILTMQGNPRKVGGKSEPII